MPSPTVLTKAARVALLRDLFPGITIVGATSTTGPSTALILDAVANYVGAMKVDEWTDPAAPDTAGLHAAAASAASTQTYAASDLIAGGKTALATYPRNVNFTVAGVTAAEAPTAGVITGTDIDGAALTETVVITASAGTYAGLKAFKTITSISLTGGTGTGATVAIGFGKLFGLSKSIKSRAGRLAVIQEVAAGAVVTTGTFASATTSPPHGTYSPSADPDASKDYAVTYERT